MAGLAFYRRYVTDPGYYSAVQNLRRAAVIYKRAGQGRVAARIESDLAALSRELERLAVADAIYGDELMRRTLKARLVRPETPGPHLSARIRSLPITGDAAGVGFADLAELDKAIDPKYSQHGTYWRAIEYGTAKHVGRQVIGYFQPGSAGPSQAEFRQHPYFTPEAGADAPAMRIMRPIEAKNFLRDGSAQAISSHLFKVSNVQAEAIASMTAATRSARNIAATRRR